MYFNTQQDIITKISNCLQKILILRKKVVEILSGIVIGIILAKSTTVSDIAENLNENFCEGTEESKKKKIKRFLNRNITDDMYFFFIEDVLKRFKAEDNKVVIIKDHTSCEDRFIVLNFMLSIGKRGIPLYYKVYDYNDPKNKSMEDVKEGIRIVKELLEPYRYDVTILADRGFASINLFEYINQLGWKYYIRTKGGTKVHIEKDEVIGKLQEIEHPRRHTRFFYDVELTSNRYKCNIASKPSGKTEEDTWYIVTNSEPKKAIINYKRRFTIEEMFRDMKSNGFGMEKNWTNKLQYFKNIMLCLSIAYVYIITVGSECTRNGRNHELGAFAKTKRANKTRVYSIFRIGMKWFRRCYFSKVNRTLMCNFLLYDL